MRFRFYIQRYWGNALPFVTLNGKVKSYENLCKLLELPHLIDKPNYLVKEEGTYNSEFN